MEQWQSRSTFVLALAAVAVGMGNVWRFGYLLGENGGAPFMLTYVAALLLLAVPLLVAEVALGAMGRGSPWDAVRRVASEADRSALWALLAPLALLTALLLLVACVVLSAWAIAYAFHHQLGSFAAISLTGTGLFFEELLAEPLRGLLWLTLAVLPLLAAAVAGVRRGLAILVWLSAPLVVVLLAVLVRFSLDAGNYAAASAFLFGNQPLDFSPASVQLAFTHALFTLGIGAAVGLTFGSYGPAGLPLCRSVLAVALFDVVSAIALAVIVTPLLYANNLAPAQGLGLLFVALPYAFGNLNLGDFFGTLFFFAVYVVALASAAALLEPLLAALQRAGLPRPRAALAAVGAVFVLAFLAAWSLAPGSPMAGLLASLQALTALVLLPLVALLVAIFVGWRVPRDRLRTALAREPDIIFDLWYFCLRFVVPPALLFAWLGVYRLFG